MQVSSSPIRVPAPPPPKACLLYAGGELHVIEYGVDEVVLRCTQRLLQPYMHS